MSSHARILLSIFIIIVVLCIFSGLITLTFVGYIKISQFIENSGYYWAMYSQNNAAIVGIFTGLGAIFTVCVFYTTYKATKNAEKNTDISKKNVELAQSTLELSKESFRKDDFIKQFTLLLDLHDKSHKIMVSNIDKYAHDTLINNDNLSPSLIKWYFTKDEAAEKLYQNYEFSPYMRILFRILKHCDESFYYPEDENHIIKEKKKYTSIVRSMIRNDVLYFVAINSMNDHPAFHGYTEKLLKFDFFEHLNTSRISENFSFSVSGFYENGSSNKISSFIADIIKIELCEIFNNKIKNNNLHLEIPKATHSDILHSFNYHIASNYNHHQYNIFMKKIESLIDFNKLFDTEISLLKMNIDTKPYNNNPYYLYTKQKISSVIVEITTTPASVQQLSDKIINNSLSASEFDNSMNIQFNVEEILYTTEHADVTVNKNLINFIAASNVYENCKKYTHAKVMDGMINEKNIIFRKIINVVIEKMNKTTLIKISGEKFIIDKANNIVFENSKINAE
ncbi:hypothetical protein [Morganella morganii]|uniref:hypothetical protein n=1 Tax=Morganella morganii TaxID=582 RepID=UPI0034E51D88